MLSSLFDVVKKIFNHSVMVIFYYQYLKEKLRLKKKINTSMR